MFFGKLVTISVTCMCVIFYNVIKDVNGERLRRMVNAYDATIEEFPSHAFVHSLYIRNGRYSGFYCGGSLVTHFHILTAAHCTFHINERTDFVHSLRPEELFVTLGVNRLQETSDNYSVIEIHRHEQYHVRSYRNPWSTYDIAILELDEQASLYTTGQIINLPCNHPALGDKGILLGASPPSAQDQSGGNLQKAQFKVVECTDWEETGLICVSSKTATVTLGDSGSAFIIGKRIYGIISTIPLQRDYYILTDVFYYFEWIVKVIGLPDEFDFLKAGYIDRNL